jgi:carboxypeptidase C (cathepsin A)
MSAEPDDKASAEESDKKMRQRVDALLARDAVTRDGSVTIAGRVHDYAVRAEFVPVNARGLDGRRGEPQAAVFATSYVLKGTSANERPVCFAFNGGPGSASIWLHLGALGPKRLVVPDDVTMPEPPYAVVDNPLSWLEHFDLVFLDPPHTGWSASASEEARKKLLSVDGDVDALAEVMRTWLGRHRRWGSQIYLAGECYGTTRGAALADKLLTEGVALSGLILVSCAMDLQSLVFSPRNDLPFALFLPAFAGVAQFHGKLSGPLGQSASAARDAAAAFVQEEYLAALHAGARLGAKASARVSKRLSELTGLPASLVEEHNLRVSDETFFVELLRDRGLIVGRLDARGTGPMAASRTRQFEFDPGIEAIAAPYTMAAHSYFGELGLPVEERYEVLSMDAHKQWNWNRGEDRGNGFATTSNDLSRAMRRNPHLRVLVASGHYDLGTPPSATDWSLAQLDVPPDVRRRIEHHYYDAGHMMYTREADLKKMKHDLCAWLEAGKVTG